MEVEEALPNVHDCEYDTSQPESAVDAGDLLCGGGLTCSPDEAYAAKAMPDLGLEVEDFQAQTWRIERWSQQPKRLVGPEFSCGGHKWCVRRHRPSEGRLNKPIGASCSFLRATPAASQMTWSLSISTMPIPKRPQRAGMRVLSSVLPYPIHWTPPFRPRAVCPPSAIALARLIIADAHHRFVAEECDWGFTRFVDLRKLYTADVANGKTRPTIENDEVEITAYVRVLKDPTGVLWHNFVK